MTTLTFKNTAFSVVNQNNQIWLAASDIGKALAYKNPIQGITLLFNRYQDEFTPNMTALIDMQTNGGMQKVRIFSLRGAHLIGMLSHTKVAKDFRRWVLDILDKEVRQTEKIQTTVDDRTGLRNAVNMLVSKKGLIYSDAYNIVHQYMNVESIEDIAKADLPKAIAYVHKLVLEGELIDNPTAHLPKNDFRTSWNDDELKRLASFWCATYEMHDMLKRLEPILSELGSTFHARVYSQVHEYTSVMRFVHYRLVRDIDHFQYSDPHDRQWQYCLSTINRFKPRLKRINF